MKKALAAITAAATLTGNTALCAFAQNSTVVPIIHYPPDNMICGELIIHTPADNATFLLSIFEISPENPKQLVNWEVLQPSSEYVYKLDDAIYTIQIEAPRFKNGGYSNVFASGMRFPLPDEIENIKYCRAILDLGFTDDCKSDFYMDTTLYPIEEDGISQERVELKFALQSGLLGDVNGDGSISEIDASQVLTAYAASLLGNDSATQAQVMHGDINGDKQLTDVDATMILRYYASSMLYSDVTWFDIIFNQK